MENELLDDNMGSQTDNDVGFILTQKSTYNLYQAAKWARIVSVLIIGLHAFSIFSLFFQLYTIKTSTLLESLSFDYLRFIDPISSIVVAVFLFYFGNNFIKGYAADNDELIDNSLINLQKYFKFSIFVSLIGVMSILVYSFLENFNEFFKSLIIIIPVGLLLFYFYQNRESNTIDSDNHLDSTENK